MALEQIGLAAVLDDKNFQQGLARYTSGIGQMTKITDGAAAAIGGAFKVATGALLVGVGAIGGILATSVKAAADAEQVAAQTDAVLQSTKGVAGMTREAVGDLATALSELTPFEDDAIQGGENLLLTFTNIGKYVFPLATETMLDLSQAMGQDLKQSAIQLGKALNDPVKGIGALAEVGVNFTDQQKKMVEQLVKAGKTEEAQRVILKELQTEFGGAAKAAGKTFAGQLQILKNTLGNVQEEIGGALLPILTKLAGSFVKVLADPKVKAGIKAITQGIEAFANSLDDLVSSGDIGVFADDLREAFGIDIGPLIDAGRRIKNFIDGTLIPAALRLRDAFQREGLAGLGGQIAKELQAAWPTISAQLTTWKDQFWNWLTGPGGAISQAQTKVQEFAGKIGPALAAAWPVVSKQFTVWGTGFWDWLTGKGGAISQVASKISEIAENIVYYLPDVWSKNIQPTLMQWAGMFWNWLTGQGGAIDNIATAFKNLTDGIKNWTKDHQNELNELGKNIALAICDGISNLFKDQGNTDSVLSHLVTSLNQARINLGESIANVGGGIASGIAQGFIQWITGKEMVESARQALNTWFSAAVNAFVLNNVGPLVQLIMDTFKSWLNNQPPPTPTPPTYPGFAQFANGGWVPQTGMALVHRGEYVIPARQAQSIVNHNSRTIGAGAVVINFPNTGNLTRQEIRNTVYATMTEVLGAA